MRSVLLMAALLGCDQSAASGPDAQPTFRHDATDTTFDVGTTNWDVGVKDTGGNADSGGGDAGVIEAGVPDADVDAGEITLPAFFPLVVGATWTFLVTEPNNTTGMKTQTVLRTEQDPNLGTVFVLETQKPSGRRTVSWQADTGRQIIRLREEALLASGVLDGREVYVPHKLRVPNDLPINVILPVSYTEEQYDGAGAFVGTLPKNEQWLITGVETITVPAGTFETIRVARRNIDTLNEKVYWFADGIGKIREVSIGQNEELSSYDIP